MKHLRRLLAATFSMSLAGWGSAGLLQGMALADEPPAVHMPLPWQMGMQPASSPVAESVHSLNDLVLVIITVITIFVAALLLYVIWRFSAVKHPNPSRTSHNTILEVAWTVIPVLILVVIAVPSFRLVFYEDRTADPFMTIKVTGHQWYWEYAYPDRNNIHFESYVVPEDQLKPGQLRLLDVDNKLVLPAGKRIRILTTSADVIHSFFIPSLGVQRYAIPGRTIETWVQVNSPGVYYGECNQICGTNHSAMPISIEAMSEEAFNTWIDQAKTKFADRAEPAPASQVAAAPRQMASPGPSSSGVAMAALLH